MTSPYLVPCLAQLRREYNLIAPNRDKGADGWIGDAAHLATNSDHNPDASGRVLAVDVDSTGPWPDGLTFADTIAEIIDRERAGREDRLEYVIWDRHIYMRRYSWIKYDYTGIDPHTWHAHFSARHDHHGESDTRGWNLLSLLEEPMPTAQEIVKALLEADLGHAGGGDTVGVALQSGYNNGIEALQRIAALEEKVSTLADRLPVPPVPPAASI